MKNTFTKIFILFFITSSLFSFSFAEKYQDLKATDYVNDYANVLTADQKNELSKTLGDLEKAKGYQVAVFIVNDMNGDYIEHYAVQLYQQLGIGHGGYDQTSNQGALFLVSINDHAMRIEVGYGLEPTLTDGISQNILDNYVRPEFKKGDYYAGIKAGVDNINYTLGGSETPPNLPLAGEEQSANSTDWFTIIVFVLVFGVNILGWLFAIMARTKSWWLGGVATFIIGFPILYFLGFSILKDSFLFIFTITGFLFDYFISKHYKYWQQKIPVNGQTGIKGGPAWWAGGAWGPGGGKDGGSGFGGFGGGGMSGGGGASSSW